MQVRSIVIISAILLGASRLAQAAPQPLLDRLLAQAFERNPEIQQARAAVEAERYRVPQAGALPDPVLSLGIQNDGFKRIAIGEMDTSFFTIMASQTFPWPGKRGLREQVATIDLRSAETFLARAALSLEAQVRAGYVDLLLAREELVLTGELEDLWQQAQAAAKVRYESGQAPQSDLLRAQLEVARLAQRRSLQEAQASNALSALNRIVGNPLAAPLETSARIAGEDPQIPSDEEALRDAEARSPELAAARLALTRAGSQIELARKETRPDVSVQAGVMPRGRLEPMWQFGVSIPLLIWTGRKQGKAVEENERRAVAATQGAEAVRQVLALRTRERLAFLNATVFVNQRYRTGLLALSRATALSTLSQYQVGRLPFTAVLEALGSYVGDRAAYLESSAQAQRIAIAQREVSLDPVSISAGGTQTPSMPAASAGSAARPGGSTASSQPAAAGGAAQGVKGM